MDTSGPKLTAEQVAQVAYNAGFRGDDLARMVAISYRESGWYPGNNGRNTNGTVDHGLWMINDINKDELAMGDWRDPQTNANMAMSLFKKAQKMWGDPFRPWASSRGSALLMLPQARIAANKIDSVKPISYAGKTSGSGSGGTAVGSAVNEDAAGGLDLGGILDPLKQIGAFFKFIGDVNNWKRLGLFAGGALLLLVGAWHLVQKTGADKTIKAAVG